MSFVVHSETDIHTYRRTDRQAGRQTETNKQTGKQAGGRWDHARSQHLFDKDWPSCCIVGVSFVCDSCHLLHLKSVRCKPALGTTRLRPISRYIIRVEIIVAVWVTLGHARETKWNEWIIAWDSSLRVCNSYEFKSCCHERNSRKNLAPWDCGRMKLSLPHMCTDLLCILDWTTVACVFDPFRLHRYCCALSTGQRCVKPVFFHCYTLH